MLHAIRGPGWASSALEHGAIFMGNRLFVVLLIAGSALLVCIAALSLAWPMMHDSPIMLYVAYLMARFHYVPYRDVFDMNMPGAYLLYLFVGGVFGYGDLGFRLADLLYLVAILTVTWSFLRQLGTRVAWCATVVFGLAYLQAGPTMSLQREYLILLPLAVAVLAATSLRRARDWLRFAIVGLAFGMAATIKPHAAIGYPLVLAFQLYELREHEPCKLSRWWRLLAVSCAGLAVPVLAALTCVLLAGALPSFLDVTRNYWPLYAELNERHRIVSGLARLRYLGRQYFSLGGHGLWLVPGVVGTLASLCQPVLDRGQKRQVLLLGGLACLYSIYPLFSGQFWDYHWLPFLYFLVLVASLCFVGQPAGRNRAVAILVPAVAIAAIVAIIRPPETFYAQLAGRPIEAPVVARAREIAAYLEEHLQEGDRVQPLDWTGGAVHAMLIARAEIATPFIYDFHFYHHVSNPYTQDLRRRFLEALEASRPRFVIEVETRKPWVSGPGTSREFPELRGFLDGHYAPVFQGEGYTIHERVY